MMLIIRVTMLDYDLLLIIAMKQLWRIVCTGLATPCQSAALLWRANFTPLARVGAPIMKDCKVGERLAFFLSLFIGSELSYHIASKHPAPTLPIISQDSSTCLLFFSSIVVRELSSCH